MKEEIRSKITEIFRRVFEDEALELSDEMSPESVEKWDSVTNVVMLNEVEQEFGIKFALRDVMAIRSVESLIQKVEKYSVSG